MKTTWKTNYEGKKCANCVLTEANVMLTVASAINNFLKHLIKEQSTACWLHNGQL